MKTLWEWSLSTEANRLLQAARNVSNGFYHTNNYPVLPWTPKTKYLTSAVYLPKIDYVTLPRFWEKVAKYNFHQTPLPDTYHFLPALTTKLSYLGLTDPTSTKIISTWDKYSDQILDCIYQLIPSAKDRILSLTIRPTYFGTGASFNAFSTTQSDLHLALRIDQGIWAITEAILTALTRLDAYDNFGALWSETEFFVDYLLARSPLADLLESIEPHTDNGTISNLRLNTISSSIRKQSRIFLASIGAPSEEKPFTISGNQITYLGKPIVRLTDREHQILTLLISHSPELVTYDDIADTIFTNDTEYSLYTISKIIERLRTKLESQGISSSYLATDRNKGYYLKQ